MRPKWKVYLNDLTDVRLIGFPNKDKLKVAVIWTRKGSSFAKYKVTTSIPCHLNLICCQFDHLAAIVTVLVV